MEVYTISATTCDNFERLLLATDFQWYWSQIMDQVLPARNLGSSYRRTELNSFRHLPIIQNQMASQRDVTFREGMKKLLRQ